MYYLDRYQEIIKFLFLYYVIFSLLLSTKQKKIIKCKY